MEEATQFTEFQFQSLTESNRSSGLCKVQFAPRMYFTCNPGGVGHIWVKRLFVDKDYKNSERADDYEFIRSYVYDNKFIMENSPDYVRTLENLPEDRKKAMLHGDWDIFSGQYFSEFRRDIHVIEPFIIPKEWNRFLTIDYGLDMLAAYWVAIDAQGNAYCYKELYESNLIISDAAIRIKELTNEDIYQYYAPPDLWNRRQDTGKSAIDIFAEHGLYFIKASNDRVQGWYGLKEWLKPMQTKNEQTGEQITTARLKITSNCTNLIRTLPQLQHDERDPNDVANEPHELTHAPDAIRYLLGDRPPSSEIINKHDDYEEDDDDRDKRTSYFD
jgi:phage terminase large subunit